MLYPLVGQIALYAFKFPPSGWAPCAGQLLSTSQNTVLFSVLGSAYGGDGNTNFALPDYRTLAPAGMQYCISLQGIYPQRGGGSSCAGEVIPLPYSFAPPGLANCAGQLMPVSKLEVLFQVLGTRFGGDGETTFGLPNLTSTPPPPSPTASDGSSLYFISLFGIMGPPSALLGTVQLLPFESAPAGWSTCQGQLLPIPQNQALFSLLGTTFGGDGHTTFGLPDLRQVTVPAGMLYCICVNPQMQVPAQERGEAGETTLS